MPGLTSSMNIGLSGLQASQGALSVIGHNIANVNTPNYSRQRVELSANASQTFGTLEFGSGVSLNNIMGMRDKFLEMQIIQSSSRQQGADTRYAGVEGIASVFQDESDAGLSSMVQNYFKGFQQLAAKPEDGAVRTNLIGQAQSLVTGLKTRYQLLEDQRTQADRSVSSIVNEINSLSTQIAALNNRIASEPSDGADSDGRDQRQELANKLASLVGVQVFEDNRGRLQVMLDSGAAVLVSGGTSYQMSATPDVTLQSHYRVDVDMGGGTPINVTSAIREGSLGANLDLRDNVLAGYQQNLDELAAGLVASTNQLHRTGYGIADNVQRDFFLGSSANYAASNLPLGQVAGLPTSVSSLDHYKGMVNALSVNAALVANPMRIAASDTAGVSGNVAVARSITALQSASGTVDTNADGVGDAGPYSSVISGLVNTVGTHLQGFKTASTSQDNLLAALNTQRDRISSVDMDEEATALLSYQRGYQASAHFISVIDQLNAQLISQFAT